MSYSEGKFLIATSDKASLLNEQNLLTITGESLTVGCKQIAGILARRIVCWKKVGDELALGERFGMIKFGSRTDLIMPASVELRVKEGMRVRGGATVIAKIRNQ
jgi:phosphatidylserine decarboxylase